MALSSSSSYGSLPGTRTSRSRGAIRWLHVSSDLALALSVRSPSSVFSLPRLARPTLATCAEGTAITFTGLVTKRSEVSSWVLELTPTADTVITKRWSAIRAIDIRLRSSWRRRTAPSMEALSGSTPGGPSKAAGWWDGTQSLTRCVTPGAFQRAAPSGSTGPLDHQRVVGRKGPRAAPVTAAEGVS